MKITTGIDLVDIARIAHSLENPRFLLRVFSQEEREMFRERGCPAATIAANFAAKEAFSKALGTGLSGFALEEISVLRDKRGAPYLQFTGRAAQLAGRAAWSVSLTHTDTVAAASAVALWPDEEELKCTL